MSELLNMLTGLGLGCGLVLLAFWVDSRRRRKQWARRLEALVHHIGRLP